MGEWGVRDAAGRLAKLLSAKGRKCEVVDGDGDWPVGLVVDGTHLRMRQYVRRFARTEGEVVKNVFNICYSHVKALISKTGKVDLDEIEQIVERRKRDKEADAATETCRKLVTPIIAEHPSLINQIGEGGEGGMVSAGKLVGVWIHDRLASGSPGYLNIHLNGTLYDASPEDLAQLLRTIEDIERRRNTRIAKATKENAQ